ncbi:glycoside hydrolase family 53 protein [Sphaerobolus stellatus SS14]|nr:glycoside hydrolase family 53 protein [Sphaerobolus stellatus SS14]
MDVDYISVSFNPFYDAGATLSALKSSLTNLANTIPVSAAGQETWIKDIKSILAGLPNGLGQGIFYWEPSWVGSANLGSSCADNLLVNSNGSTRTSINIFNDM